MAHITEVTIEGLAGSDKTVSVSLNRDVNIVYGLNGSGKTSLLRILDSAMSGEGAVLANVPFVRATVKFYTAKYDRILTRTLEKPKPGTQRATRRSRRPEDIVPEEPAEVMAAHPRLVWNTRPNKRQFLGSFHHVYLPTSRLYGRTSRMEWRAVRGVARAVEVVAEEDELNRQFATQIQHLWATYSADLLGKVRTAQESGLADILKAILSTRRRKRSRMRIAPQMAFERVSRFLARHRAERLLGSSEEFGRRYLEDPSIQTVVNQINKVEQLIDDAMAPRAKLQSLIDDLFTRPKRVSFSDKAVEVLLDGGRSLSLAFLSSGEKHILRLLIDTLRIDISTLLIDEPEISLHVDWQRKLVAAIRQVNPNCQIILATHSPEIMADVEESKIFRL